jgi:hypothetical protein
MTHLTFPVAAPEADHPPQNTDGLGREGRTAVERIEHPKRRFRVSAVEGELLEAVL